jgi:hypothetical protein
MAPIAWADIPISVRTHDPEKLQDFSNKIMHQTNFLEHSCDST